MIRFFLLVSLLLINNMLHSQVANSSDSLSVKLDEVVVKAAWVIHSADLEEYIVTNAMREKGISALELLNQVHGLRLDRMTNKIVINNKNNVLLIVNGKKCSYDYIKSINPGNITRIRVIKNPKGRYLSEGYDAVIDLSVRYYDGIEFVGSNFLIINPTNNNGNSHVIMEQPMVSFTYTKRKLSFFGSYVYGVSTWNTPVNKALQYGDMANNRLCFSSDNGTEKYKYYGNSFNAGINFQLNQAHEISAEFDYRHENIYSTESELYNIDNLNSKNRMGNNTFLNFISNTTYTPAYTGTVFYLGHINNRVAIYSDISYNSLNNKVNNKSIGYIKKDSVNFLENRYVLKHTTDIDFNINKQLSLKFGYFLNWKKFRTKGADFNYSSIHNRIWSYLSYNPSDNLSFNVGTGGEMERIIYGGTHKTYFRLLPSLQVNYKPTSNFNMNFSYISDGVYPSLSNLNSVSTMINPMVYQSGNPSLKSAINHKVTAEFTFFNKFTFSPSYLYSHDAIVRLVQYMNPSFKYSYYNSDIKQFSFPVSIDQPIGKYFDINAEISYYRSWGKYKNYRNTFDGWLYGMNVSYLNHGYMVELGYNRNLSKQNIIQGYLESGFDSWVLSFNKQWFEGRLSTMFTWFVPLECGINKYKQTLINTVNYQEKMDQSLKPYKNAILMKFIYRFNAGKNRMDKTRTKFDLEKRISGGFSS